MDDPESRYEECSEFDDEVFNSPCFIFYSPYLEAGQFDVFVDHLNDIAPAKYFDSEFVLYPLSILMTTFGPVQVFTS